MNCNKFAGRLYLWSDLVGKETPILLLNPILTNTGPMPIRIDEDQPTSPQDNRPGRGGGGGLLKFLPLILLFVFKRPKLLVPILLIGGAWYFFLGGKEMLNPAPHTNQQSLYGLGADFDEQKYDATEVFEPLAYGQAGIPSRFSLEQYAPSRLNQGEQGSCVGWASAYAARSIMQARATGQDPNRTAFSPSFLYNHISLNRSCQGSYLPDAMSFMKQIGCLPLSQFPYREETCQLKGSEQQRQQANQFRIRGYQRLTKGGFNYGPDIPAIKQYVAKGGPVVIGMEVGGSFIRQMEGQRFWRPTRSDYGRYGGFGGHAMCVIGYDDNYNGGSFQIMNSWGSQWGQNGLAWVTYKDFQEFVKEAYGIYPMGQAIEKNKDRLAVKFGLVLNENGRRIPLRNTGNNTFRTLNPVRKGQRFKIEVINSTECYTYVLGRETDGSSYVLFPYNTKHSPYCGITGVRLFPKNESLYPDEIGSTDIMAIVVSKRELDYQALNRSLNQNKGSRMSERLNAALKNRLIPGVSYKGGEQISFDGKLSGSKDAVAIVMSIDKK